MVALNTYKRIAIKVGSALLVDRKTGLRQRKSNGRRIYQHPKTGVGDAEIKVPVYLIPSK